MSIKQSAYFKGSARTEIFTPKMAGHVCEVIFTHTFTETVEATDILEVIPFIPYGKLLSLEYVTENITVITFDIGFITGTPGDTVGARTADATLINDGAAASGSMTLAQVAAIAKNGNDAKSIGLVPSAQLAAAANKKITFRLRYTL